MIHTESSYKTDDWFSFFGGGGSNGDDNDGYGDDASNI